MFAGGGFQECLGGIGGIGILEAFALADGVVREDGKAVAGEGTGEAVVGGFAGETMARRDDDGWEFFLGNAGFCVGEVKECGDGEVGLGFEEDFLDAEAVGLRRAEDFGVEGSFFGEAPNEGEDFLADVTLARLGLSAGRDGRNGCTAASGFFGGNVVEVLRELCAADVGRTVGVRPGGSGGWRLCGSQIGYNAGAGDNSHELSHRLALIHRGKGRVKMWS